MRHPLTGSPLNYSIQTRERWDTMISAAEQLSKQMDWSVGIWVDVSTWGVQFFAGVGALRAHAGFRALIRLTPWQEVRPEVSEAVWTRYHREHMLFAQTRGNARITASPSSYEDEFVAEKDTSGEPLRGRGRRLAAAEAASAESTAFVGRAMARGLAELGGPLPRDPDEEPEANPAPTAAATGRRTRKKAATGPSEPSEEDPF